MCGDEVKLRRKVRWSMMEYCIVNWKLVWIVCVSLVSGRDVGIYADNAPW